MAPLSSPVCASLRAAGQTRVPTTPSQALACPEMGVACKVGEESSRSLSGFCFCFIQACEGRGLAFPSPPEPAALLLGRGLGEMDSAHLPGGVLSQEAVTVVYSSPPGGWPSVRPLCSGGSLKGACLGDQGPRWDSQRCRPLRSQAGI